MTGKDDPPRSSDGPSDLIGSVRGEVDATGVDRAGERSLSTGESAGDRIGRYRLVERAGEGGMGSVWLAEQSEPVERKVALKIIKLGMDTREVVTRFEAERQALALMDHPYIANVLDGGVTAEGRPYFVMDFVEGAPITDYCNAEGLGLGTRLELFQMVCEAVQHAHQKGVIHRDLKPSNILVTGSLGRAVPKVIDFGIAKATDAELTKKTLLTEHAQVIGTPEYMAPEQAGVGGIDIDTRADVYSLGVLLYELLTGTKPLDAKEALRDGYVELLRRVREEDPPRPSTRVSSLSLGTDGDGATSVGDATTLSKRLRGDLDWIVMKALEKDRDRRYDSADAFAADVMRFLEGDPVVAAPPSATYRMRKFAARHRGAVAAALIIFALLILGSIGTGVGLWKALTANEALGLSIEEEKRQRTAAIENEKRARAAEQRAQERADELEAVASFQSSQLSDLDVELMGQRLRRSILDEVDDEEGDRRVALSDSLVAVNFTNVALEALEQNIFDRAVEAIDDSFDDQPQLRARLLAITGGTLHSLGLAQGGLDPLQRAYEVYLGALGPEHQDTLGAQGELAGLYRSLDRLEDSLESYAASYEGLSETVGPDHPDALVVRRGLGVVLLELGRLDEAEFHLEGVLERQRATLGDNAGPTLATLNSLGELRKLRGDYAGSEEITRAVLDAYRRKYGSDSPETLSQAKRVGELLHLQEKLGNAEPFFREALAGSRRVLGDDHPATLRALNDLGNLIRDLGRLDEATPILREALERKHATLGRSHTSTMISVNNLGLLLEAQGDRAGAHPYFVEAYEICMRTVGERHQYTLTAMVNLSRSLGLRGEFDEAIEMMTRASRASAQALGDDHPLHKVIHYRRAIVLQKAGRHGEAATGFEESAENYRDAPAGQRAPLGLSLCQRGASLVELGRFAEAEAAVREGLQVLAEIQWQQPGQLASFGVVLARALRAQGRVDEAVATILEAGQSMRETVSLESEDVLSDVVEFFQDLDASFPGAGHGARVAEWQAHLETFRNENGK